MFASNKKLLGSDSDSGPTGLKKTYSDSTIFKPLLQIDQNNRSGAVSLSCPDSVEIPGLNSGHLSRPIQNYSPRHNNFRF